MGAPKKKWSTEEENALKAGIDKYGAGKWSAILNDPEYREVLQARTNVDLKDKWRNINVMMNGIGYRQRGVGVPKHKKGTPKPQNKNLAVVTSATPLDVKPAVINKGAGPKPAKTPKLQKKELAPVPAPVPDLDPTSGLPLAVKPEQDLVEDVQIDPSDMEIVQVDSPKAEKHGMDFEQQQEMLEEEVVNNRSVKPRPIYDEMTVCLKKLMDMTADELSIVAAEAVAEADAALEQAEIASMEADEAERVAEQAQIFAQAASKAYKRYW